ncbi:MAG TPA: hypothetical protein VLT57_20230 [Bryobacteraceae bacterium]|nr:hypothetical protein [Bryobacteraceae bacterium]
MMNTAVATDDSRRFMRRWDIERLETRFGTPYWLIKRSQGDEESARNWLEIQRRREPECKWRIKIVTTTITEAVIDA